jgi:pimeloyl-ACP methyl ester carboxylesterase
MSDMSVRVHMLPGNNGSAGAPWQPALSLTEQTSNISDHKRPVLYVHGFTFPSALSVFWKLDGRSWADEINSAGLSLWGLDFAGLGGSERYLEMETETPPPVPPLGAADDAAGQVLRAVTYIVGQTGAPRVSIVAHSRGSIVAGLFATRHPELVDRLVFFGPITERHLSSLPYGLPSTTTGLPSWRLVTIKSQYGRFVEDVPPGHPPVLLDRHFESWAHAYLATDPTSKSRNPESVKVPNGATADIIEAWVGKLAYDPEDIVCPLFVVRGEWDSWSNDADAARLLNAAVKAPAKQYAVVPEGTHLLLLEQGRHELHRLTNEFLAHFDHDRSISPSLAL